MESQALAETLFNYCQVIEAKHKAYTDRLNDNRGGSISIEALRRFVRKFDHSESGVTQAELRGLLLCSLSMS